MTVYTHKEFMEKIRKKYEPKEKPKKVIKEKKGVKK